MVDWNAVTVSGDNSDRLELIRDWKLVEMMDPASREQIARVIDSALQLSRPRSTPFQRWIARMPNHIRAQEVMASPPTITYTTTNALASARFIRAIQDDVGNTPNARYNGIYHYRKAGNPKILGTNFPQYEVVNLNNINSGLYTGSVRVGIPIITDAPRVVLYLQATTGQLTAKVDGQYVSLTPQTLADADGTRYYDLDFGSYKTREIEFIAYGNLRFGGLYLAADASVQIAPPKGPRVICLGDSFGGDTGANSILNSMFHYFGDCLGLDDVWSSSVGGTGILAAPGGLLKYRDRLASDVIPYSPDAVIVWVSLNDLGFTPAQLVAESLLIIAQLRAALPYVEIIFAGPGVNKGGGFAAANSYNIMAAIQAMCVEQSCRSINLIEQKMLPDAAIQTTTLTSSAAANATTIATASRLCPGVTYKFADGTHVYCKSIGGTGGLTATIDMLLNAQASGATLTQCGNSLWSGSGRVGATTGFGNCDRVVIADGAHPSDSGHQMIGAGLAWGVLDLYRVN